MDEGSRMEEVTPKPHSLLAVIVICRLDRVLHQCKARLTQVPCCNLS